MVVKHSNPRYVKTFDDFRLWLMEDYPNTRTWTDDRVREVWRTYIPPTFPARVWWAEDRDPDVGPSMAFIRYMTEDEFFS